MLFRTLQVLSILLLYVLPATHCFNFFYGSNIIFFASSNNKGMAPSPANTLQIPADTFCASGYYNYFVV
jgi:hypothetical protein